MPTVEEQIRVADLAQATVAMAGSIESTLAAYETSNEDDSEPNLIRLAVGLPSVDPLQWLQRQRASDKLYWSDRGGDFETAGIGTADTVESNAETFPADVIDRLRSKLTLECAPLRYYGGFRFDRSRPGQVDEWQGFSSCRFVLPRFELYRSERESWLVCNLVPPRDRDNRLAILAALADVDCSTDESLPGVTPPFARSDGPDFSDWTAGVEAILRSVADGELSKVVLARRTTLEFASAIDPLQLLRKLKERAPGCFHYCFQFAGSATFVGASPERLYRRVGSLLESEAVAGTRPRGMTADEDNRIGDELLASTKDAEEHRFVVDDIAAAMKQLCRRWKIVNIDGTDALMKLARIQHLVTQVSGDLVDGYSDSDILSRLHPTSAVGGVPTTRALGIIKQLEPFDRGWYAAPVGWFGHDSAEFAVGIRSGLVVGRKLHLYAGAGIVQGSSALEEWREIDSKLANSLAALE